MAAAPTPALIGTTNWHKKSPLVLCTRGIVILLSTQLVCQFHHIVRKFLTCVIIIEALLHFIALQQVTLLGGDVADTAVGLLDTDGLGANLLLDIQLILLLKLT